MAEHLVSLESLSVEFPRLIVPNAISKVWEKFMVEVFQQKTASLQALHTFLADIPEQEVLPGKEDIWAFTNYCPAPEKTKVIIIGQDPYFNRNVGYGLGFSVRSTYIPPSLRTILEEVYDDISTSSYVANLRGFENGFPIHGCLDNWARQGVVMLDAALTVEIGKPRSHLEKGWEDIIVCIIRKLQSVAERDGRKLVFMLWGAVARDSFKLEIGPYHKLLIGGHPSSTNEYDNFLGRKYFSQANDFLAETGDHQPIDWSIN